MPPAVRRSETFEFLPKLSKSSFLRKQESSPFNGFIDSRFRGNDKKVRFSKVSIGIYAYREAKADRPRAVVGLTDLSARVYIRKQLGDNLLSFAMPFSLFREMEANVEGSFLQRHTWQELLAAKRSGHMPAPSKAT